MRFLAIDFETANDDPSSACAVGLVLTDGTSVLAQHYALIRPQTQDFTHTPVHGIAWEHVAEQKDFAALWPEISPLVEQADAYVAHDAGFARDVFEKMLDKTKIQQQRKPFLSTQKMAKRSWQLPGYTLSDLAVHFGIHVAANNALSEALACARILGRAIGAGTRLEDGLINGVRIPHIERPSGIAQPQDIAHGGRAPVPAMAWVIAVVGGLLLLAVP